MKEFINAYYGKMKMAMFLMSLCFCFVLTVSEGQNANALSVHYLEANDSIDYSPKMRHRGFFDSDLQIYCYRGNNKTLARFFETIELQLDIEGDDYTQYEGISPEEVQKHRHEHRSLFSFNLFSQKKTRLQLSPFQQQCIGIESMEDYRLRLLQVRIDFWRVIQLAIGLMFFLSAGELSHNSVFYYITGVTLGICSSFMLLIWLAGKLFPRKTMMYGVLIGGWTIGIYIIQMLWENLQVIVLTYRTHVFWYILITGFISFLFCYRIGPPKNKRSKNIVKWLLQLMSWVLIYFCSRFEEAAAACIILATIYYYFPRALFRKIRALILSRFPPKRRLLTSEEFYEQGVRETTKALSELREYASSPECKQWRIMTQLKDPMRFAAFVEGASHLRDDEILRYDYFKSECYNDDGDDDDDDDGEVANGRDTDYSQEDEPGERLKMTPIKKLSRQPLSTSSLRRSYAEEDESTGYGDAYYFKKEPGSSHKSSSALRLRSSTLNNSKRLTPNGSHHHKYLSPTQGETQRASSSRSATTRSSAQRTLKSRNDGVRSSELEYEHEYSSSD